MHSAPVVTFYTVWSKIELDEDRWRDYELPACFYESIEEARREMFSTRDDLASDRHMAFPIYLEKVETVPMTPSAVMSLLNHGLETIIGSCEIIEEVDRP
ncbi:hypothetical protein [Ensifer sp. BR816]|uniref:hypothetical protein n=1 Tax=Rhizobium sp. (strain BR816) TaxID=1057002 RepID=UPI000381460A|nr:hypothetical protein [Ensifer sp. BR816]